MTNEIKETFFLVLNGQFYIFDEDYKALEFEYRVVKNRCCLKVFVPVWPTNFWKSNIPGVLSHGDHIARIWKLLENDEHGSISSGRLCYPDG